MTWLDCHTRCEYSSLATASAQQCKTCYGRDGTIASRSINTERGSTALVLTRKQKGGPGFQVRILLTYAVTVMMMVREGEDFPPRKKENSDLGYAAELKNRKYKIQLKIW